MENIDTACNGYSEKMHGLQEYQCASFVITAESMQEMQMILLERILERRDTHENESESSVPLGILIGQVSRMRLCDALLFLQK